jgi:hypothetical protein
MVLLNSLATDCSLLRATIEGVRFGMKFIFASKVEVVDGSGLPFKITSFFTSNSDKIPF